MYLIVPVYLDFDGREGERERAREREREAGRERRDTRGGLCRYPL